MIFPLSTVKKQLKPTNKHNNDPQKSVYTYLVKISCSPDLKFDEESDFDVPGTSSSDVFELIARNHIFCVKLLGASF